MEGRVYTARFNDVRGRPAGQIVGGKNRRTLRCGDWEATRDGPFSLGRRSIIIVDRKVPLFSFSSLIFDGHR